jgi:hypothetical protein
MSKKRSEDKAVDVKAAEDKEEQKREIKKGDLLWAANLETGRFENIRFFRKRVLAVSHDGKLVFFDDVVGGYKKDHVYDTKEELIFAFKCVIDDLEELRAEDDQEISCVSTIASQSAVSKVMADK